MAFNRVYSPYPGAYVLESYSEVEPASAAQRTLEVTPLVARGVIEDYTFPETAEVGADKSWSARVHNIGDTGIIALGIVNTTGNPGAINVTWQGTVHNLPPGTYLKIRTTAEVPNCTRIDTSGTIEFTVTGGYTIKLWGMHPVDSTWYYDDEKTIPVNVAESGWPYTAPPIHLFDNYPLKAEWFDISKAISRTVRNIDTNLLLGGKLEYTVKYTQGLPIAEDANIALDDVNIVSETLWKGESKSGTIDLTGLIGSRDIKITLSFPSAPGIWSEVTFDIWTTFGFSEKPKTDPSTTPDWWDWLETNKYWLALGVVGGSVAIMYRPRPPALPPAPIIVYPPPQPPPREDKEK